MVDVPDNTFTTASVTVGSTTNGTLEQVGDHDWYKINLTAGQSITVTVNGTTLEDSYLNIRNSSGAILYSNDDISSGINRDSEIAFTANYTGVYYIDVGAYQDSYAGAYQVTVQTYTPPPLWSFDQIADQLINGYWAGDAHHFNVTQGGTIKVDITGLTAAGQTLARAALALWSEIIGVGFQEVSSGEQILFTDDVEADGPVAYTEADWSFGITSHAHINISTDWISRYGTGPASYSMTTYIHEIGHALGLGHAGNYNGDARYPYDAEFQNDSWASSVMSYFSQTDNTYVAGQGFDENYPETPMIADILAMQEMYGLSTTTRTGDTTYGPTWSGNMGAITIFDSGGNDTINVSTLTGSSLINLNPGTFSNVLGETGNVSIALSVIIENATGGIGADTFIGNEVANLLNGGGGVDTLTGGGGDDTLTGGAGVDRLTGSAGADSFRDTAAGLNGDTITDFGSGDRIILTDAALAGFTFNLSGTTLTYTGGSLTLGASVTGTIVATAAAGGGVQLTIGPPIRDALNDFNGDGRSDILWRNDSGMVTDWLASAGGGLTANSATFAAAVGTDWTIAATGDFNGDLKDDILWRSTDGTVTDWLGQGNGAFVSNTATFAAAVGTDWTIAGVGDFNGDQKDDILWRRTDGTVTDWLGQANGAFTPNSATFAAAVGTDWTIAATGDFNGDGNDDILWRRTDGTVTDWLGQGNGGFTSNSGTFVAGVATDWAIVGVGDFNGDLKDDILWRRTDGTVTDWLGQGNGAFTPNTATFVAGVGKEWTIAQVGDFNGDGKDDILWRRTDGTITDWLGQANGSLAPTAASFVAGVASAWHLQPDHLI